MDMRCLRCDNIVTSHKRLAEIKCTKCGGQVQRMRFVRLIEGLHPLGKEHNLSLDGKYCYGTYKSAYGTFIIDKLNNRFKKLSYC
jgi:hypothetical protein